MGGRLSQYLCAAGHDVLLGSRSSHKSPDWCEGGQVVKTDWTYESVLRSICNSVDVVVHASGMNAQDCAKDPVAALQFNGVATASLAGVAAIENTQRDLNIALINELAMIFNRMNIDTEAVLKAAGTKWNFLPFRPGLVGGHCIGVDPYYLTHKAQAIGYHPEIILAGRRINDAMGSYVVAQLVKAMTRKCIQINGARVLVMGLAFKENCPDLRNTRLVDVVNELREYNCEVDVYDPWVSAEEADEEYGIKPIAELEQGVYDSIILGVAHHQFASMGAAGIHVICLPSYREGFGMVLIEAAASGLPAIASRIYGITDAVEEGLTGILHVPGADAEIADAMLLLGSDERMRLQMARAARDRAIARFSADQVKKSFAVFYRATLSPTKKLLIVVNSAASLLSHRLPLALAAKKEGYEVHISTSPGSGVDQIVSLGLTHHSIPLSRSGMNLIAEFRTLFALFLLFRRVKPDIVHLVTIKPVLYGGIAARAAGVPGVVAAISGLGFVFMNTGLKVAIVRMLAVRVYRLAFGKRNLKVIFQNPDDCKTIMKATHLEASKVVMIRGSGVDLLKFAAEPFLQGSPVVVMAARLLRDKGVNEFVEAAMLLKQRGLQARFWLVGDLDPGNPTSVEEAELTQWRAASAIELLGHREDIAQIFAQSHIVVLPSYREGLPKVLLEAAACGRAIVTSDVPGCRDAIEAGVTGILVPPRDALVLADAIERLLQDAPLREQMGRAGRNLAEREFSIEKVVEIHLAVYRGLLEAV